MVVAYVIDPNKRNVKYFILILTFYFIFIPSKYWFLLIFYCLYRFL